jgi:perosamine synthetase
MSSTSVISALQKLHPKGAGLHEPWFEGREWEYVKQCLDTRWVSYVGGFVDRFEKELAAFCGVKRAVATSSGTAALHIALKLVGVRPDDEVLIPTLTFAATGAAVRYCSAIPHFVDSSPGTLGVDPDKLGQYLRKIARPQGGVCINALTGRTISALVPVHIFGHPVDLDPLLGLAGEFNIPVIEDAAESLGSYYKGRHTGTLGRVAALSFNGNKVVTTGGGGALLTDDDALADRAKHLTTTAKIRHRWRFEHDEVGYNYRLPNLLAAVGVAQLECLPSFLERKRRLAERYFAAFEGMEGIARVFREPTHARSNYWLNALILDSSVSLERDSILDATNDAGIMTRPAWDLLHRQPPYADGPRMDLSQAEDLERRLICVPSSVFL